MAGAACWPAPVTALDPPLGATSFLQFTPFSQFTLPCSKLQQLSRLHRAGVNLQLGPPQGGSSTTTAPMLPKLRALKLRECVLSHNILLQLAQCSGVTRVKLEQMRDGPRLDPVDVKHLLQGMSNLSRLSLARVANPWSAAVPSSFIPFLPARSLTGLTWGGSGIRSTLPDSTSALLRQLTFEHAWLIPRAFTGLSLLTKLQFKSCNLLLPVRVWPHDPGATWLHTVSVFVAALRGMHHLQHLALAHSHDPMGLGSMPPLDYAALTASSQLTYLKIASSTTQTLPTTAIQHMFPPGKQFPQLQLLLSGSCSNSAGRVTTAELRGIISACPALCALRPTDVLAADTEVSILQQLPSTCRSLTVGGKPFGDDAAGVIAQLTQLTCLDF